MAKLRIRKAQKKIRLKGVTVKKKPKEYVLDGSDVLCFFHEAPLWEGLLCACSRNDFNFDLIRRAFPIITGTDDYWTNFFNADAEDRAGTEVVELFAQYLASSARFDPYPATFDLAFRVVEIDSDYMVTVKPPFKDADWIRQDVDTRNMWKAQRSSDLSPSFYFELYRALCWGLANFIDIV